MVDPCDAGFSLIARPRQYLILVHKLKTELVNDIAAVYDCVKDDLSNNLTTPKDCLFADPDEIAGEILEIASKRRHLRINSMNPVLWSEYLAEICGREILRSKDVVGRRLMGNVVETMHQIILFGTYLSKRNYAGHD